MENKRYISPITDFKTLYYPYDNEKLRAFKNNYIFFSTGKYQHIIINSPSSEDDLCLGENN